MELVVKIPAHRNAHPPRWAFIFCISSLLWSCAKAPDSGETVAQASPPARAPTEKDKQHHRSAPAPTRNRASEAQSLPVAHRPLHERVQGSLHYIERIIPAADLPNESLPVLVLIHGLGDTPNDFIHLTDGLDTPRRELALRGFDAYNGSFGDGWSWFPVRVRDRNAEALADGIQAAAAKIAGELRALNVREQQPNRRFIVSGFSQGGMLSYALAVHHSEIIASSVPISGWLPPSLIPDTPDAANASPIFALHGADDQTVPYASTKSAVATLQARGARVELTTFDGVDHEIPRQMRDALYAELRAALGENGG